MTDLKRSYREPTPGRSWRGDAAFASFIVAQISDGLFTYIGMKVFGVDIEANPLIAWYVRAFGLGVALTGIKVFAVTCGAVLHQNALHRTLGVLTLAYVIIALWPWSYLFTGIL